MRIPLPTECGVTLECRSVRRECQSPCAPCWLASDLHALGWREGENLQIAIRSSNGEFASLPRIAADTERCAVGELLGVDAAAINPHPAAWAFPDRAPDRFSRPRTPIQPPALSLGGGV
jgi:hypothetical protein